MRTNLQHLLSASSQVRESPRGKFRFQQHRAGAPGVSRDDDRRILEKYAAVALEREKIQG